MFSAFAVTALMVDIPAKSSGQDLHEMANQMMILINNARNECGLEKLYTVPYLNDVAGIRANESIVKLSHTRPDGSIFSTAVDTSIIPWLAVYENIGAGMPTAQETFEDFKGSESHWKTIVNEEVTHMGVNVVYDEDFEHKWYWQLTFVQCRKKIDGQYIATSNSCGDLTGDGVVDIFDYNLLIRYINYDIELNSRQLESADIFYNNSITYDDALYLKEYIFGKINNIPIYTND